jgi:hypothetical protein
LPLLMMRDTIGLFVLLILNHSIIVHVEACLASFFESISDELYYAPSFPHPVGNVLILDHLNITHERGRDDWFKGFYFLFLGCVVDPRTADNLNNKGQKTLWANVSGAQQFHLPGVRMHKYWTDVSL